MNKDNKNIQPEFNDIAADERPDQMSPEELKLACQNIARDYFSASASSSKQTAPQLLYITGLPGAGKSTFVEKLKQQRPETKAYVYINFDDLRIYHPRYAEHTKNDPVNAAAKIDNAVEDMIGFLCEEACNRKLNIILDDAAMGKDITLDILSPFQNNGYQIDAVIVSVPAQLARQSVRLRFETDLHAAKQGLEVLPRWVNTQEQDMAPAALIGTAEALEADKNVHSLHIVNRKGDVQKSDQKPSDIIKAELSRPLNHTENTLFQHNTQRIGKFAKKP